MDDILDELWLSRHQKDVLFLDIIKGYTIKESLEFPNVIFYMKGDKIFIEYNKETTIACINRELIWSVFSSKFCLNYQETKEMMIVMLETHLNLKGTTPASLLEKYHIYTTKDILP